MSSNLSSLTEALTMSATDMVYGVVGGNSRKFKPSVIAVALGITLGASAAITLGASATLNLAASSSLITSGGNSITLTSTGATNVTLPTTGTLATLAGSETFTNKTLTNPILTTPMLGVAVATSLALGGATIGSWVLTATGATFLDGSLVVGTGMQLNAGFLTLGASGIAVTAELQVNGGTLNDLRAFKASVISTSGYTVATLPAGAFGKRAYVTDATTPTYNGALTGGGAVVVPVFYNGSAWVSA